MIARDPPFYWDVSCDTCAHGEERLSRDECPTFQHVVREIKSRGWAVTKTGGEWIHMCPACMGVDDD